MIQRINNYLLTHYPLVWNTRLLWIAAINLLLHLFFFASGFSAISAHSIPTYYSISSVGGTGLYTFSVLCGLLVLIVWCVFYLRNNAFKNFYRISKWYLAKEFIIIFLLIGSSITYFLSFQWGVRNKVRSITNQEQLVQEVNAINTAAVYLPYEKASYFILNSCAEKSKRDLDNGQQVEITSIDTSNMISEPDNSGISISRQELDAKIKAALRRPDAFSYLHYCKSLVSVPVGNIETDISEKNRQWLLRGRKDSIRAALQSLFTVLKKYGIKYQLNADSILRDVFSDSLFSVNMEIAASQYRNENGYQVTNAFYLESEELNESFRLINNCQPTEDNFRDRQEEWLIVGYTTLSLAVLLLCYRRFSRKVFLTSVVGTLVWTVLLGMLAAGSGGSESFFVILLVLNAAFLCIGLILMRKRSNKTLAGVLLNWHAYLAPYTLLLIATLIQLYYDNQRYYGSNYTNEETVLQRRFPIGYWVTNHFETIIIINLIVSFIYVAILFNQWAKQWQAAPDE